MENLVLLSVLIGIATLIICITVASRIVQMGESIRRMRTQIEEVNEYVFMLSEPAQPRPDRPESGLVDLPYPTVRRQRYQPEQ